MSNLNKKLKNNIQNIIDKINKKIGIVYFLLIAFFVIILLTLSIAATIFVSEPAVNKTNTLVYTFLILFLPTISVVVGIIIIVKFSIEAYQKKEGGKLRLIIVVIMALMAIIPSMIITYISNNIIVSNLEIWIDESTDKSLITLIEYSREKIDTKQVEMSNILRQPSSINYINNLSLYERETSAGRVFTNLVIVTNNNTNNVVFFNKGLSPVLEINNNFNNTNTVFINSEFENRFYINAIIPVKLIRIGTNDIKYNYAIWSEAMPNNFIEQRNNALKALRLYRSIYMFTTEFSAILLLLYVLILGIAAFFAIIFGILFSSFITSPILNVITAADSIINANFDVALKIKGAPDIRTLIHRFNIMARSLKHHRDMENRRARLETWREAAIKVAHEIKNPLTPIIMNAEYIDKKVKLGISESDKNKIYLASDTIIRSAKTINSLIKSFSEFSFQIKLSDKRESINEVVDEAVKSFVNCNNVDISLILTKHDYFIKMDREKLFLCFTNLIKNSLEAIEPKGSGYIYVSSYHEVINDKESFIVSITDTGIGISEENQNRIFEPYYTSKNKGTGLGLPMVERTISEHFGEVIIESFEGSGTTFFIIFPIH